MADFIKASTILHENHAAHLEYMLAQANRQHLYEVKTLSSALDTAKQDQREVAGIGRYKQQAGGIIGMLSQSRKCRSCRLIVNAELIKSEASDWYLVCPKCQECRRWR